MAQRDSLGIFERINEGYQNLWKLLIKPNRFEYSAFHLGLPMRCIAGKTYKRTDYHIPNHKGYLMECSLFEPVRNDKQNNSNSTALGLSGISFNDSNEKTNSAADWNFECMEATPVLVYCHSQAGNRIEGLSLLEYCAQRSMALLLFDFAGCGKSEGEFVSLGHFEAVDLDIIIRDLKTRFRVGTVSLWGRSMGAVTCILYAEKHQSEIHVMILDSPFSNLREMLIQIGQNKVRMPAAVISLALNLISGTVKEKLGVDLLELEPGKVAERCNIPALFIVAKDDEILPPKSVMDIYNRYKSSKKVLITSLEGGHAAEREDHIIEQAFNMLVDEISKFHYEQKMKDKIKSSTKGKFGSRMDDPFLSTSIRRPNNGKKILLTGSEIFEESSIGFGSSAKISSNEIGAVVSPNRVVGRKGLPPPAPGSGSLSQRFGSGIIPQVGGLAGSFVSNVAEHPNNTAFNNLHPTQFPPAFSNNLNMSSQPQTNQPNFNHARSMRVETEPSPLPLNVVTNTYSPQVHQNPNTSPPNYHKHNHSGSVQFSNAFSQTVQPERCHSPYFSTPRSNLQRENSYFTGSHQGGLLYGSGGDPQANYNPSPSMSFRQMQPQLTSLVEPNFSHPRDQHFKNNEKSNSSPMISIANKINKTKSDFQERGVLMKPEGRFNASALGQASTARLNMQTTANTHTNFNGNIGRYNTVGWA